MRILSTDVIMIQVTHVGVGMIYSRSLDLHLKTRLLNVALLTIHETIWHRSEAHRRSIHSSLLLLERVQLIQQATTLVAHLCTSMLGYQYCTTCTWPLVTACLLIDTSDLSAFLGGLRVLEAFDTCCAFNG